MSSNVITGLSEGWSRRCCCAGAVILGAWPNAGRRALPARQMETAKRERVTVDSGSLIHVERNAYSVNSRLIGERVEARLYLDHVEVWHGQRKVEDLPRLRGRSKHRLAGAEAGRV